MIRSFHCKHTEGLFLTGQSRHFPPGLVRRAGRKLLALDAAPSLQTLARLPGNVLEKLSGSRAGQWSIRINDQWRVCFRWQADAYDVEIVDYH